MTDIELQKLALLEAKIKEQEKLLEEEHADQVDPSVLLKAQKSAGFSMQDIALAMEAIEAQLTPEQIETIRANRDFLLQKAEVSSSHIVQFIANLQTKTETIDNTSEQTLGYRKTDNSFMI